MIKLLHLERAAKHDHRGVEGVLVIVDTFPVELVQIHAPEVDI